MPLRLRCTVRAFTLFNKQLTSNTKSRFFLFFVILDVFKKWNFHWMLAIVLAKLWLLPFLLLLLLLRSSFMLSDFNEIRLIFMLTSGYCQLQLWGYTWLASVHRPLSIVHRPSFSILRSPFSLPWRTSLFYDYLFIKLSDWLYNLIFVCSKNKFLIDAFALGQLVRFLHFTTRCARWARCLCRCRKSLEWAYLRYVFSFSGGPLKGVQLYGHQLAIAANVAYA